MKKNWGVRSRDRVRVRGSNRDRVRAGAEHILLFEKHPPPPSPAKKSGKAN